MKQCQDLTEVLEKERAEYAIYKAAAHHQSIDIESLSQQRYEIAQLHTKIEEERQAHQIETAYLKTQLQEAKVAQQYASEQASQIAISN